MPASAPVFLDTVALIALMHVRDQFHHQATRVETELTASGRPIVTSDWVLTEFLAAFAKSNLRSAACQAVRRLQHNPVVSIVPADRSAWQRAFDLYADRLDKNWSLVDCLTILTCRDRGTQEVFSNDRHFAQAGLKLLL